MFKVTETQRQNVERIKKKRVAEYQEKEKVNQNGGKFLNTGRIRRGNACRKLQVSKRNSKKRYISV